MFKPIEPVRLSDAVVEQVLEAIQSGDLKAGDRIPSERTLMEQFGIGRASLREALRTLETLGVVCVYPGRGAVIADDLAQNSALQLWRRWLTLHATDVLQLLEVREGLETKAVELAAERASAADIAAIEQALARLEHSLPEGDPSQRAEADIAFHSAIAEASRNRLLATIASSLMYTLHEARVGVYSDVSRAQLSVEEHREILQAIAVQDPDLARQAMTRHLATSKAYLREVLAREDT